MSGLVLTRKEGESFEIGDSIVVTVVEIRGARVRIQISAPEDVSIMRTELLGKDGKK